MRKENKHERRQTILQYSITFGLCLIAVFIWLWIAGIFEDYDSYMTHSHANMANATEKTFYLLTNATFGVGVLVLAFGLFVLASNGGAFYMIVYGIRRFISLFQKEPNKFRFKTYYDYHVYRSDQPKPAFGFLVVNGLFFVLLSLLFLFLLFQSGWEPNRMF